MADNLVGFVVGVIVVRQGVVDDQVNVVLNKKKSSAPVVLWLVL